MGEIKVKSIKPIIRIDQSQFIARFFHAVAVLLKELYGLKEVSFGVWGLLWCGANPKGALHAAWLPSRGCSISAFGGKVQLQKLQLPSALCKGDAQTPGACCCCWGGRRWMGGLGCPIQELLQGLRGLPAARMAGKEARKHGGGVWRQLLVWPWSRFLGKLIPTVTGGSRP